MQIVYYATREKKISGVAHYFFLLGGKKWISLTHIGQWNSLYYSVVENSILCN